MNEAKDNTVEIASNLSTQMVEIGNQLNRQADHHGDRLNAYVFIAHAAIVSLSLGGLLGEPIRLPALMIKIYFTASIIALLLLSIDKAISGAFLRKEALSYFEHSTKIREASRETPPRLLLTDDKDADNPFDETKLIWIANTATTLLIFEFVAAIIIIWKYF